MTPVITVTGVSKQFRRYRPDRPWTVQEALTRGLHRLAPAEYFWALRDVSLRVQNGRTVGLVGANGSGKSTLLRLIAGVGRPDRGHIEARGRIGALLDLGAGFHSELTGRENAIVSGILNGLTRRQVLDRFDAIVEFAEVERAIDNPVRTYSTGMQMRLAFSVAIHADPEILIVDEVLAVGDVSFQRKCLDRIAAFKAAGGSILLVSHEPTAVTRLCDDAVWLKAGHVVAEGDAREVMGDYLVQMHSEQSASSPEPGGRHRLAADTSQPANDEENRDVQLLAARFSQVDGPETNWLRAKEPIRIEIDFLAHRSVVAPRFHVRVAREDGLIVLDLTTEHTPLSEVTVLGLGRVSVWLDRLDVNSGRYHLSAGCHSKGWTHLHHHLHNASLLTVYGDDTPEAVMNTPYRWELTEGLPSSER